MISTTVFSQPVNGFEKLVIFSQIFFIYIFLKQFAYSQIDFGRQSFTTNVIMFFETYILCSYNKLFASKLLVDCDCYNDYRLPEKFVESIITNRGSYMACICYESNIRNRISHKSVPIMLGSYIDWCIRGHDEVLLSRTLWGLVILRGLPKMYPSFSTFDALSMHPRETKTSKNNDSNVKSIEWYTYVNQSGLALSYRNKVVTWTFERATCDSTKSTAWMDLLNEANPFKTTTLMSEYTRMFDTILGDSYCMNDLKNRQIINGPTIIMKFITHEFARRLKKKTAGCQKMCTAFESGALFQALCKKNTYETEEWSKNYPQNFDNTMHEGRSNKTAHFLSNVSRASNAAVRNSNALKFPSDATYFYCMLNTKDLKSAGEQNVLADFVVMSEETDQMSLYHYLKTTDFGQTSADDDECAKIVINGFLVNIEMPFNLSTLVQIKDKFPHVTTQYNWPYVRFSTRTCIPIKYSQQYDRFFSPAETTFFNITYPESDMLSITAKELTLDSLRKTPPAKSTVSINNIKGSIAMVTSPLHQLLMENSLGVTCYMNITKEYIDRMINFAIISTGNDTTSFQRDYDELVNHFGLDVDRLRTPESTNVGKAMHALYKLYPSKDLYQECRKGVCGPPFARVNVSNTKKIKDYMEMIFGAKQYPAPNIWNLKLYAAFGNPMGACIEDGVVVDEGILKHIPPIHYNACITVEFTYKTVKQPRGAYFIPIDESNGNIKDETIIGCLISAYPAYVKNSKHTKILTTTIGTHYYYLIQFLPKRTKMYDNIKIRDIFNNNSIMIVITGQKRVNVGIGSKVANAFGQKNVISMTSNDLKDTCWGITRDGRKVHAQIVYSEVSLIGRIPSGQLYDMFTSDDLAIGPNRTFIAPVNLVIHTLHPYTNIKVFDVKVDTLTNINGFDSQNLSNVSNYLRSDKVDKRVLQVMGLHGYKINMHAQPIDKPIIREATNLKYGKELTCEQIEKILRGESLDDDKTTTAITEDINTESNINNLIPQIVSINFCIKV